MPPAVPALLVALAVAGTARAADGPPPPADADGGGRALPEIDVRLGQVRWTFLRLDDFRAVTTPAAVGTPRTVVLAATLQPLGIPVHARLATLPEGGWGGPLEVPPADASGLGPLLAGLLPAAWSDLRTEGVLRGAGRLALGTPGGSPFAITLEVDLVRLASTSQALEAGPARLALHFDAAPAGAAPDSTLRIDRVTLAGLEATSLEASFVVTPDAVLLRHASARLLGGMARLEEAHLPYDGTETALAIDCRRLDTALVPGLAGRTDLAVSGIVSGRLTATFSPGGLFLTGGRLALDDDAPSRVGVRRPGWLAGAYPPGSRQRLLFDLVEQAARDFRVDELAVEFQPPGAESRLTVRIRGAADRGASRFPLVLEIPVSYPLADLLQMGVLGDLEFGGVAAPPAPPPAAP